MNKDIYGVEIPDEIDEVDEADIATDTHKERDISWFQFNRRVLECADEKSNPINERLNFLGITESNLDEFIEVRFGKALRIDDNSKFPLDKERDEIKSFKKRQLHVYKKLAEHMNDKRGLKISKVPDHKGDRRDALKKIYDNEIYPLISSYDIDFNEINILSRAIYVAIQFEIDRIVLIQVTKAMKPYYIIGHKLYLTEDIIRYFAPSTIFTNQPIKATAIFRVLKDGSILLNHECDKKYVNRMEDVIRHRFTGKCIWLESTDDSDPALVDILSTIYKIPKKNRYLEKPIINLKSIQDKLFDGELDSYKKIKPRDVSRRLSGESMFDAIEDGDIFLHHPYDSYKTVVNFIEAAANDSKVETIRQTVYRVSSINSPIINALCTAADHGKSVTCLVEIKARYDEENNIQLIEKLKGHGVNVVYGDEYLKTHCKMCIVTRRAKSGIKMYAHIATGNYNEKTASMYTDLSLITANKKICTSLIGIYNILTGHSKPEMEFAEVYYSPLTLRTELCRMIDKCTAAAKKKHKSKIFIKVNAISDKAIEEKLMAAAKAGVDITIVCRGACSLYSKYGIKIKSIVGRFLEHSRIFIFETKKGKEVYISSADLLTRNLDRRVEVLLPINDEHVKKQINHIKKMLNKDTENSFVMNKKGDYDWLRHSEMSKKKRFDCQAELFES